MANPFPFTAGQVLTAAQMNGIGESVSYTPTWTNVTVGNATQVWKYVQIQKLVMVRGYLKFGSTTSISGIPILTLPVTAVDYAVAAQIIGFSHAVDDGASTFFGPVEWLSTTTARIRGYATAAAVGFTGLTGANFTSTIPFTWTTNDELRAEFVYEAA